MPRRALLGALLEVEVGGRVGDEVLTIRTRCDRSRGLTWTVQRGAAGAATDQCRLTIGPSRVPPSDEWYVARTASVWLPGVRPVSVSAPAGPLQGTQPRPSTSQANVLPASEAARPKPAVPPDVVAASAGPEVMVVTGASSRSQVHW